MTAFLLLGAFLANKRSALLEAVDLVITETTVTTAASLYAQKTQKSIETRTMPKEKSVMMPFTGPHTSQPGPLVL